MYRRLLLRLCALAMPVSVFLSACVFDSEEEYFKNLTKPDPSSLGGSIHVDLGNYNPGDTIDLYGTTIFNYSISGMHGRVESATLFLDGEAVSNSTTNSFMVYMDQLSTGIFALQLDVVTSTGSGSLAEAVGAEKFNITMKWIVRVDLSVPPKPVATLDIVDGFLTVQWSAYSRSNFQSYLVKRKLANGATQSFEIKNKQTVSWRDESYVGGHPSPTEYTISIVSETGTATSVPVSRVDPTNYSFSFNSSDSTFTYKWKPTKFYGTFKGYKFGLGNGNALTVFTNINDSVFTYKLSTIRFGGDASVGFTLQSKSEGFQEYWTWNVCILGMPLPFAPVGEIRFNSYLNSFVAVDADKKLLELNEQFEPVRTIVTLRGANWRMPYPGNFIYIVASAYDDRIDRLSLEDDSEVSYEDVYLSYQNSNTVASSGLICLDYDRPPIPATNKPWLYVTKAFDPSGGSNAFGETSNTTKLSAVISEDGRFIWANGNRVFRISGGISELVGSFSGIGSFIGFRPDNSDEMMFRDGEKIKFYDANTFALIRTIGQPGANHYWRGSYDVQTKNMLWKGVGVSTRVYTVNIETGVSRSIEISTKVVPEDLYMAGGLLIYKGTYIQVK